MEWFQGLDAAWAWLAIGIALAALELALPGIYLIWLAVAALVTGALTAVLDLGTMVQVLNFFFLSLIMAFSAKRFLRDRPIESENPMLNRRGGQMIGTVVRVVKAIDGGEGRVTIGDSEWIAKGPDAAVGEQVRVIAAQGATVTVEPLVAGAPLIESEVAGDRSA
ncbi:NfeD family protein [Pontixanthobacter aestiaquae]|uniref:NfeD family protein n=1 Tax=Pontixanthobacter aestiaquae TaxID=1509367 RepID=A0A844Z3H9_9SPHN|nr:NfeD family protein [Pontixanthobacter aestiaquae]MDN3647209.1 NfeD family protein [Pontixanthobacter aestiaquae]MXO81816.1 NfeD family protein [Pontixanthobacter aestiaquae]